MMMKETDISHSALTLWPYYISLGQFGEISFRNAEPAYETDLVVHKALQKVHRDGTGAVSQ